MAYDEYDDERQSFQLVSVNSSPGDKIGELALLREEREVLLGRSKVFGFYYWLSLASFLLFALGIVGTVFSGAWLAPLVLTGVTVALIPVVMKLSDHHDEAVQKLNEKAIPPQLESAASKEMEAIMNDIDRDLEG